MTLLLTPFNHAGQYRGTSATYEGREVYLASTGVYNRDHDLCCRYAIEQGYDEVEVASSKEDETASAILELLASPNLLPEARLLVEAALACQNGRSLEEVCKSLLNTSSP